MDDHKAEADALLKRYGIPRDKYPAYRETDGWLTSFLHLGLVILGPILSFFGTWFVLIQGNCANGPQCDTGPFAVAYFFTQAAMFLVIVLSAVVSIVLRALRRPAWYVPVSASVAMILCFVVAIAIASSAAESGR